MKSKIYNQSGKEVGTIDLPESVFGLPWNADLVHQVVVSMESNARTPIAHTKDRGEVRGGGKKPWRQKGTGRARHGSIRSPLWIGGGVTFGPRNERNYKQKINRKMRTKALYTTLSQKVKDNELLFVETLVFSEPKTRDAKETLTALSEHLEHLSTKRKNTALIALSEKNENTRKSFRNFRNIKVGEVRNLNPVDVLKYKYVIVVSPKEALATLEKKKSVSKKIPQKIEKTKKEKVEKPKKTANLQVKKTPTTKK